MLVTNDVKHSSVKYRGYNGVTIAADIYGEQDRPPVLFAHGGGQTRHAWRNSAKVLAEQGFQSICVDLRGHGESDWCPQGDYRIEAFAEDLVSICGEIGSPPVLVGASLGGISAMVAAGELSAGLFRAIVFVDVANAHHMVAGDHNDAFTDAITGFLLEM